MKKTLFKPMLVALVMLFVASVASVNAQDYASKMKLWYDDDAEISNYDVRGEKLSCDYLKKSRYQVDGVCVANR